MRTSLSQDFGVHIRPYDIQVTFPDRESPNECGRLAGCLVRVPAVRKTNPNIDPLLGRYEG